MSTVRFDSGELDDQRRRWSATGVFRNTWQKMNEWGDDFERRHFDGNFVSCMVGAPMRAGQERYWREKVSKAKAKAKTKRKVEAPPAGCAQSVHHSKGRQVTSCEGLRSEELDEAEQELLGPATREKLSSATARNSRRNHVDEVKSDSPLRASACAVRCHRGGFMATDLWTWLDANAAPIALTRENLVSMETSFVGGREWDINLPQTFCGLGVALDASVLPSREHHVSWLLAAQEQLLQRSGLCEPSKPCLAAEANGMSLMDENAARRRPGRTCNGASDRQCSTWERTSELTLTLTGDFVDELARGYSQPWFQDLVRQCIEESGDQQTLLERLHDVAFEVQKPVLENWGFGGNDQGLFDMTSILREHSAHGPLWLQEKIFSCLRLLLPCQQESAIGDDFERRHFEGDFLGAVARAPVAAGEVLSEAIGQIVDSSLDLPSETVEAWGPAGGVAGLEADAFTTLPASGAVEADASLREVFEPGGIGDRVKAFSVGDVGRLSGMESVAEELQEQLQAEQARRQGRCEALRALRAALLKLPSEAEKSFADEAAGARAGAAARASAAKRALEALKDRHEQTNALFKVLTKRTEMRNWTSGSSSRRQPQRHNLPLSDKHSSQPPPAGSGLGTASKIELAELLGEVDEARLHRRRELKALQQALEILERENEWLRTGGHDRYEAPASFAASLRRLFHVAIGKEDPSETALTGRASQA
eukprot:s336_g10.t1